MIDYYSIIDKYIEPGTDLYKLYTRHVNQVAKLALDIGRRIGISEEQLVFIEEAAMLHDIGVVEVDCPVIHCCGSLPYMYHHYTGRKILMNEGLPKHAEVAARHFVPGTVSQDVERLGIKESQGDYLPITFEQLIIGYADMFSTKDPAEHGCVRTVDEVLYKAEKYGVHISDKVFELSVEYGQLSVLDL